MTRLGISWLEKIEAERHNAADEAERERSNRMSETLRQFELDESRRHNFTVEAENLRHNREMEEENLRSHMADEAIRRSQVSETIRHNLADESNKLMQNLITQSYNEGSLAVKQSEAESRSKQATAALINAKVKETEANLKKELQPYTKWESGSRTASNIVGAYTSLKQARGAAANTALKAITFLAPLAG